MTGLAHVLDILTCASAELRAHLPHLPPGLQLAVEVEVRRMEGDIASLRDQLAASDPRSRFVVSIARCQPAPFEQRDPPLDIALPPALSDGGQP